MSKKRKLIDEGCVFQDKWMAVCLICSETIAIPKKCNLKRHYCTKHSQCDNLIGQAREEKVVKQRKDLIGQQTFFVKKQNESNDIVQTSYIVAEKIF